MSAVDGERVRELMHDVGKQVARTARNVGDGPVPTALVRMLLDDLYALRSSFGVERASTRFARLAKGLEHPRLQEASASLAEVDALETEVRAHSPAAVARAVVLARAVETSLRALLAEVEP